jgi:hypothetical protein
MLYNKEYKMGSSTDYRNPTANGFDEPLDPVDPTQGPTKSYFPPTDFNADSIKPFGELLDSPLEH